jgi:hypothetical protein
MQFHGTTATSTYLIRNCPILVWLVYSYIFSTSFYSSFEQHIERLMAVYGFRVEGEADQSFSFKKKGCRRHSPAEEDHKFSRSSEMVIDDGTDPNLFSCSLTLDTHRLALSVKHSLQRGPQEVSRFFTELLQHRRRHKQKGKHVRT